MKLFKYYILLISVFCAVYTYSQSEVNVLTKRIIKNYYVKPKDRVTINAIKANIKLLPYQGKEVKIEAKLISKNKDVKQAKKELEYIQYSITKSNKAININNIFILPEKKSKVTSVLQVDYTIYTPENIKFKIINKYGNIEISNINSDLEIDLEYGDIVLNNVSGTGKITSKFAIINTHQLNGEFNFISENSQFKLININGAYSLKNTTGDIYLDPGDRLKSLSVKASFSDVVIKTMGFNHYNYILNTKYAMIQLPEEHLLKKYIIKKTNTEFEYQSSLMNPSIYVETSFKDIKFE